MITAFLCKYCRRNFEAEVPRMVKVKFKDKTTDDGGVDYFCDNSITMNITRARCPYCKKPMRYFDPEMVDFAIRLDNIGLDLVIGRVPEYNGTNGKYICGKVAISNLSHKQCEQFKNAMSKYKANNIGSKLEFDEYGSREEGFTVIIEQYIIGEIEEDAFDAFNWFFFDCTHNMIKELERGKHK